MVGMTIGMVGWCCFVMDVYGQIKWHFIGQTLGFILVFFSCIMWIDWLWIFGVEDSQQWTWWNVIYQLAK
tara:strand:+ start:1922 stop:2131 length:210 start_codon:yes stop_codon:yes gene_type:complete